MGSGFFFAHPRFFPEFHNTVSYNLDAVVTAIRSGNVTQLSPFFDVRVDISLPDKSDTYSKTQAEMVIGDFFNTNAVRISKLPSREKAVVTFFAPVSCKPCPVITERLCSSDKRGITFSSGNQVSVR